MDVIKGAKLARLYRMRNCVYDCLVFLDPNRFSDVLHELEKVYNDLDTEIQETLPR